MLQALTDAEIQQLRGEQGAAGTKLPAFEGSVEGMIDARAKQLMGIPIQKADGSVAPMGFDAAQRLATEQAHMQLRAQQTY